MDVAYCALYLRLLGVLYKYMYMHGLLCGVLWQVIAGVCECIARAKGESTIPHTSTIACHIALPHIIAKHLLANRVALIGYRIEYQLHSCAGYISWLLQGLYLKYWHWAWGRVPILSSTRSTTTSWYPLLTQYQPTGTQILPDIWQSQQGCLWGSVWCSPE